MSGVLGLRDIPDVERHVAAWFDGLALAPPDRDSLVLHGIAWACRIDRALPPEQALAPVLDRLLGGRLESLSDELAPDLPKVA